MSLAYVDRIDRKARPLVTMSYQLPTPLGTEEFTFVVPAGAASFTVVAGLTETITIGGTVTALGASVTCRSPGGSITLKPIGPTWWAEAFIGDWGSDVADVTARRILAKTVKWLMDLGFEPDDEEVIEFGLGGGNQ